MKNLIVSCFSAFLLLTTFGASSGPCPEKCKVSFGMGYCKSTMVACDDSPTGHVWVMTCTKPVPDEEIPEGKACHKIFIFPSL
jgi:hypothetical protein